MKESYYIEIGGEKIPVSKEIYYEYKRPAWREAKRREVRLDKETSLDALEENGFEAESNEALIDEIVADKLLLDELMAALSELPTDERALIDALFYQNKSERELAQKAGISPVAVHKRKHKILRKIYQLIKNEF